MQAGPAPIFRIVAAADDEVEALACERHEGEAVRTRRSLDRDARVGLVVTYRGGEIGLGEGGLADDAQCRCNVRSRRPDDSSRRWLPDAGWRIDDARFFFTRSATVRSFIGLPGARPAPACAAPTRGRRRRPLGMRARTSGTLYSPPSSSQCIAAIDAAPSASLSSPARLPHARTASPLPDSRAAHSRSGSWLPAMIAGAACAGRYGAPTSTRATRPPPRAETGASRSRARAAARSRARGRSPPSPWSS